MNLDPGLLAAIKADPADDLPRLLAADWLADHDEGERAEFIRVQCELAQLPDNPITQFIDPLTYSNTSSFDHFEIDGQRVNGLRRISCTVTARGSDYKPGNIVGIRSNGAIIGPFIIYSCSTDGFTAELELQANGMPRTLSEEQWDCAVLREWLRRRVGEIQSRCSCSFMDGLLGHGWKTMAISAGFDRFIFTRGGDSTGEFNQVFHRGFISKIRCTWADWVAHADAILSSQPITKVELTTMPQVMDIAFPPRPRHAPARPMEYYLESAWPGITFTLPQADFQRVIRDRLIERMGEQVEREFALTPADSP